MNTQYVCVTERIHGESGLQYEQDLCRNCGPEIELARRNLMVHFRIQEIGNRE